MYYFTNFLFNFKMNPCRHRGCDCYEGFQGDYCEIEKKEKSYRSSCFCCGCSVFRLKFQRLFAEIKQNTQHLNRRRKIGDQVIHIYLF